MKRKIWKSVREGLFSVVEKRYNMGRMCDRYKTAGKRTLQTGTFMEERKDKLRCISKCRDIHICAHLAVNSHTT